MTGHVLAQVFVRPPVELFPVLPILITGGAGMLLLLVDVFFRARNKAQVNTVLSLAAIVAAGVCAGVEWSEVSERGPKTVLSGMIAADRFSVFFSLLFCVAAGLAVLVSESYVRREGLDRGEWFALILMATSGMMLMSSSADLVSIFIALELLSIPLYILCGFARERLGSQESAMKYFLLGSFSSAFFLYGLALMYGATGTTQLGGIVSHLTLRPGASKATLFAAFALLLVGLAFKVAAVPFHMWTPDVYQGAPTPVTGFMAAGAKAAGFAAMLRIFVYALRTERIDWQPIIWTIAVATMVLGAVVAVVQTDIKRMMAFSSISHAGYVLVGVVAVLERDTDGALRFTGRGVEAALFYLLAYTFTVVGTFAVVAAVSRRGDDRTALGDYAGLARRNPGLAALLTLFMLSNAGFPLTGGFVAKFEVFGAAVGAGQYWLAATAMVTSVIAAFFYLRVVLVMYLRPGEAYDVGTEEAERLSVPPSLGAAIAIAAVFTLVLGILPGGAIDFARGAVVVAVP